MKVLAILLAVGVLILGMLYFHENQNIKTVREQLVTTSNQVVAAREETTTVKREMTDRVTELQSTIGAEKAKADQQIGQLQERIKSVEQDLQDEKTKLASVEDQRGKVVEQLTTVSRQAALDPLTEWFVLAWDAFNAPQFPYDEALRLARVVGVDLDHEIIGHLAQKKASDVLLWDSATRAAKGALGPPDGSRAMLDAVHHAAHTARTRTLDAARDLLVQAGVDQEPVFLTALEAVLEVLPPSRTFTGIDLAEAVAPAASDFEALEHLRRLAFTAQVDEPEQLRLWKDAAV